MGEIIVSIIIPVYNEAKYIENNILGILSCNFPKDELELIYVDGMSTDNTREIIETYSRKHSFIRCLTNEKKYTPHGMNIGIFNAKGKFVILAGAHSKFAPDYIKLLVNEMGRPYAVGVGGRLVTEVVNVNKTTVAIRKVLSDKFGVGNGLYRTTEALSETIEADTAAYLCYRKEKLVELGGYNEKLIRNHDIELNKRIKKIGGKIYLVPKACVSYYARETYRALAKNNFQNGKWNVLTVYYTNDIQSLSTRHFVPLIFLLSLIIPALFSLFWYPFIFVAAGSLLTYNLLIIQRSLKLGDNGTTAFHLWMAFYTLHFSYGAGSISGLLHLIKLKLFGE